MSVTTWPTLVLAHKLYEHAEFFYVTATTGGTHAAGSYHYRGEAEDIGCGMTAASKALLKLEKGTRFGQMNAMAAFLYLDKQFITELLHTKPLNPFAGWFVKNGKAVSWRFYGLTTVLAHRDHVHLAITTQAGADAFLICKVQRALKLPVDGVKGPKTSAAIKAIQKAYGLTQDSVVGPKTVAAIRKHNGWRPA